MRIRLSQLRSIIKEETKRALLREGSLAVNDEETDKVYLLLFPDLVNEDDADRRNEIMEVLSMSDEVTKVWAAAEIVCAFIKDKSANVYTKAANPQNPAPKSPTSHDPYTADYHQFSRSA